MKFPLLSLLCCFLFLSACGGDTERVDSVEDNIEAISTDIAEEVYPNPKVPFMQDWQAIDSTTDYVIFPLLLETQTKAGKWDSYSSGRSGSRTLWWNLLFYNPIEKTEHLLADKKVLIESWKLLTGLEEGHPARNYIFYNLFDEDTNNDGKLTPADASKLAVSDKEGRTLVNLTPDGYSLAGWNLVGENGLILAQVRPDANQDQQYNGNDPSLSYRINLDDPTGGEFTFTNERLREIEALRDKRFPPAEEDE